MTKMIKIPSGVFQTDVENNIRERFQAVAAKHACLTETAQKIGHVSTLDPSTTETEVACGGTTRHLSVQPYWVGQQVSKPFDSMVEAVEKLIPCAMSTLLMLFARLLRDGVQAGFFGGERGNLHLNTPLSADAVKTGLAEMSSRAVGDTLIVPHGMLSTASRIAKDIDQIKHVLELPSIHGDNGWYLAAGPSGLVGAAWPGLELAVSDSSWELVCHVAADYGDSTTISRFDVC